MIKEQVKNGKSTWKFRAKYRGREKSGSGFPSEREARAAEKKAKNTLAREFEIERKVGIKWGALIEKWELGVREGIGLDRPLGLATRQDYVRALEIFTAEWDGRSVQSITRYDLQQILMKMDDAGLSNSRKRAVLNAINHIYRWGADHGILGPGVHSPAMGIHIRRDEDRKPDILTINEIRSLLKAARDLKHEWYPIWAMALHTGARSGELFALEWSDVDLENRRLFITKSYNRRFRVIKTTKGGLLA